MTTFDLEKTKDITGTEITMGNAPSDPSERGDMASQLSKMMESGTLKTKTFTEATLAIQSTKPTQESQPRGGRGTKMAPGSLQPTLQKALDHDAQIKDLEIRLEQNEASQINKGLRELEAAHAIFVQNINTLKNKLSKNPAPQEEKRLNIMLSMARDHMRVIEKILPSTTSEKDYDNDVFKKSVTRFKEYEEARRKQMLAEINQLQGKQSEEEVMAIRRKSNYLYGEIFELTKQEGGEIPQEKIVANAETTKETTMPENPQTVPQPQEAPTVPESAVAQSPKLNQEALDLIHNAGGVPMFVTSNLKRIAEENGVSVSDTDTPNQIIEKLQALDSGEIVVSQVATATESAPVEPAITIEPTSTKENSLQNEALAILENEGGTTPEATPEPEVEKEIAVENITEGIALEGSSATTEAKVETAEEKKERILSSIYIFHNVELPERSKKAGMSENMLDVLRAGGAVYNELPLKKKLLVSLTLFGTAWIAGGTIASVAMGGSLAQRALGGMATFVAAEGALKASAEKDGRERGAWEKRRHTAEALIAGFLVGGGYAGQAFQNIFSPIAETAEKIHEFYSDAPLAHVEAPIAAVIATEKLSDLSVIKQGEGFWQPVHNQLALQHPELSADELNQKTQELLIKNNIVHPDGSEVRVSEVGAHIVLNPDNTITYDPEKTYEAGHVYEAEARLLTPEETIALVSQEVKGFDVIPTAEAVPIGENEISTGEAVPAGILEQPTPSEAIAHPDAHIKVGNIEGTFKYSPDGKTVIGFTSTGTLESSQIIEAKNILNDGWRGIVLSNETGLSSLNTVPVEASAKEIYQYEQLLKALDGQGGGMTPEADFLRDKIARVITDTEKIYGDVFKDIGGTQEVVSAIPMEETNIMPQDITPGNPEVVTSASKYVHTYVNDMFGSKGIFGFGAVDGMKTPNWLDFANRPVAEIMQAQPNPTPSNAGLDVGMKNNDALAKIQQYLKVAIDETGVQPVRGETTEKFLTRAAEMTLGKIK